MARQIAPNEAVSVMTAQWERFVKAVNTEAEKALAESGERVKRSAVLLAPVQTGALRASARVETAKDDTGAEMAVSFGGGAVTYAVRVHEDLTQDHPTGQAGFLRIAADQSQAQVDQTITTSLKNAAKEDSF